MHRAASRSLFVSTLFLSMMGLATPVSAQCECDHMLGTDVTVAVGDELGVMPGDTVCLEAGHRDFLRIQGFVGTAAEPITVINCDGVVEIRNTDRAYALVIEGASEHLRVTGTGVEGTEYGFRVSAPARDPYPGNGVWIQGRATDVEVDHMEIFDTGFAGLMAKTDPGCEDRPFWEGFVQRNTHLHHLWVHDTGGEGFYIGSTQGMGYNRTCDGAMVNIPAHRLEGVDVHDMIIEDTGWDGIQIGFATDCTFHDSIIRRVGRDPSTETPDYQRQGLQLGGSVCEVRRNHITDGPSNGIIVLDIGDTLIADNVIAGFGADGIYLNHRDAPAGTWTLIHNTVADFTGGGFRGFGSSTGTAVNNLFIGAGEVDVALPSGTEVEDNVTADDESGVVLGGGDFHLTDGSPARGAGRDLTSMGYPLDLDLRARAMPPSVGAYEHVADAPDVGPIDASSRPDASSLPRDASSGGDGGPGGSSGGCGCRAGRESGAPWPVLIGAAVMGLRRRRRHSQNGAPSTMARAIADKSLR